MKIAAFVVIGALASAIATVIYRRLEGHRETGSLEV
jgi:hypothetical protein